MYRLPRNSGRHKLLEPRGLYGIAVPFYSHNYSISNLHSLNAHIFVTRYVQINVLFQHIMYVIEIAQFYSWGLTVYSKISTKTTK